ncbi:hypothetical protein B0H16DRAFT_1476809 [Mycena metata]|uniref:Uncharacterized protein n=1 Tax=Mycena metata TaxID=1033252 RepID=A0AAD7HBW7_9AGAR|nr:hypothetical protein B0H16DRAFT_1476809 [Mycena metata]
MAVIDGGYVIHFFAVTGSTPLGRLTHTKIFWLALRAAGPAASVAPRSGPRGERRGVHGGLPHLAVKIPEKTQFNFTDTPSGKRRGVWGEHRSPQPEIYLRTPKQFWEGETHGEGGVEDVIQTISTKNKKQLRPSDVHFRAWKMFARGWSASFGTQRPTRLSRKSSEFDGFIDLWTPTGVHWKPQNMQLVGIQWAARGGPGNIL